MWYIELFRTVFSKRPNVPFTDTQDDAHPKVNTQNCSHQRNAHKHQTFSRCGLALKSKHEIKGGGGREKRDDTLDKIDIPLFCL